MTTYLTCAETAKLIRKDLKQAFPGVKFSVRSNTYAGGASIDVGWTDGPTTGQVQKVTSIYESRGFDGMVDYAYHKTVWRLPNGDITRARNEGSACTGGVHEGENNPKPHPDAEEVSFGASYVLENRTVSQHHKIEAARKALSEYGETELLEELEQAVNDNSFESFCNTHRSTNANEWISSLYHQELVNKVL